MSLSTSHFSIMNRLSIPVRMVGRAATSTHSTHRNQPQHLAIYEPPYSSRPRWRRSCALRVAIGINSLWFPSDSYEWRMAEQNCRRRSVHPLGGLVRRYPAAPGGLQAGSCAKQRKEEGCRKRGGGESAREREALRQTEKTERERERTLAR